MKHKYQITPDKDKKSFFVQEIDSENIIGVFSKWDDARKFVRDRNKGLGFGGWTPKFFLIPFKVVHE